MAPIAAKLTLVPYLQAWDAAAETLTVNVLVIPIDDPRRNLTDRWTGPAVPASRPFDGASLVLEPHLSGDASLLPTVADIPGSGGSLALPTPPNQRAVFDELERQFDLSEDPVVLEQKASQTVYKYLPKSYRRSFAFVAPKTPLAVTDDSYHCDLKCPPSARRPQTRTTTLSWGDALAALLRVPAMARAAGILHTVTLSVPGLYGDGGWLFFSLAKTSDFWQQADQAPAFQRRYATRVPSLKRGTDRPVFTPVLFPVAADAAAAAAFGSLDTVFGEARQFDDGFAKVVHARQPLKNNLVDDDETQDVARQVDGGIQLGWDDEDVVESLNRAVGLYPDGSAPPDAPTGVGGYRVDVRTAGTADWASLCRIESASFKVGGIDVGAIEGELGVEIYPNKIKDRFWLPAYYTRWLGHSLVAETPDRRLLLGRFNDTPSRYRAVEGPVPPLRYGQHYEFRVRLADTTGGSPSWTESPVNPGQAPIADWHFRRAIPPRKVLVTPVAPAPGQPPTQYRISRPGIGYPEAVFAGAVDAERRLTAISRRNIARAAAGQMSEQVEVADPDAGLLEVTVYVRAPRFDPLGDASGWQILYRTHRAFQGLAADGTAPTLDLSLDWVDCARLSDVAWEVPTQPAGTVTGKVPVPTEREVRVEVRAVGAENLRYWMPGPYRRGTPTDLEAAPYLVPARAEAPVFAAHDPVQAIASVYLQPDPASDAPTRSRVLQSRAGPVLSKRLAAAVGLVEEEGTIFGPEGERLVFGCAGLKHHLPPDASSLALTAQDELPHQWISVLRLRLDRDWTWIGLATPSFKISRKVTLIGGSTISTKSLGTVTVAHTVNGQSVRGTPNRESTELVFVDGMLPQLEAGLPYVTKVEYTIMAVLADGRSESVTLPTVLPVTTPPRQLPKIAAVGHAFSDYVVSGPDYAETETRRRMLWVEFAEAPVDLRDTLFVRVLAQSPDPMLMPATEPVSDPPGYEDPALDPEMVRIVRPEQPDDFAGLSAMQRLIPAADDQTRRFYLLPLPPNMTPTSKELFGFFTYEFRVGHDRSPPNASFWSTAQGRYGPAMVLEGVQHPAPPLLCKADRQDDQIEAFAPFAEPVHEGRARMPLRPNTQLWVALYARVMQADGSTRRPIQLDARRANLIDRPGKKAAPPTGAVRWPVPEVKDLLDVYGLPEDTPLSALAIEVLPEPNGRFADPLGGDLSQVRILRTSPLVEVASDCCS